MRDFKLHNGTLKLGEKKTFAVAPIAGDDYDDVVSDCASICSNMSCSFENDKQIRVKTFKKKTPAIVTTKLNHNQELATKLNSLKNMSALRK